MTAIARLVGAGAALALLAGCASPSPVPPPLTDAEVRAIVDGQNTDWWLSMFPDEPVPDIPVVAEIAEADVAAIRDHCVLAAGLPGVESEGPSAYRLTEDASSEDLNRVVYRCVVQYPIQVGDPERSGYFSTDQLAWLYDYYASRLVPCLRLAGYDVGTQPMRDEFVDSVYGGWSPYFTLSPSPDSPAEWARVDERCPPPPFGVVYRPGDEN